MKRYFKSEAESDLGLGIVYTEFNDQLTTRQVEIYDNKWFSSLKDVHQELGGPSLGDLPLSRMDFDLEDEISEEQFESIWKQAEQHYLHERPLILYPVIYVYMQIYRLSPKFILRLRVIRARIRITLGLPE